MIDRLPELLDLAVRAAQAPSSAILAGFRNPALRIETKADGSVVTPYDRGAERQIRQLLAEAPENEWPVMGEELGDSSQGALFRWLIDPIDGTLSYTRGIALFGTLVAFEDIPSSQALIGVIHLPTLAETYSAARGRGASCNGASVHVNLRGELRDSIVSASSAADFAKVGLADRYARLCGEVRRVHINADCWTHAMVARGAIDAAIELDLNRWDIAATEVLIEEAGGQCLIRPALLTPGKYDAIFGAPKVVKEAAQLLDWV